MRNTWRYYFRRLASAGVVCAATTWTSALCYAQIAADTASDPVYADGWQAGDNGGTGFLPWNFDGTYQPAIQGIDTSSPFNNIGTAWRMAINPNGLPRAGRGFPALQTGQTLRMVVDNPTDRRFFKGYIIRASSGGGNICYAGAPCTPGTTPEERLGVYMFDYFTYGSWLVSDLADDNRQTMLFDNETAAAGIQIDIKITGPESYELVMDPLGTAATYTQSGNLGSPGTGPINWVEFLFFNTATDPNRATDFYIRSLEILGDSPGVPGDYNNNGTVDAADYVLWRNGGPLQNEIADPGTVSAADYTAWRGRFGSHSHTGAGSGLDSGAVPEPSMLASLLSGMVSACAAGVMRLWRRSNPAN